MQSVGYYEYVTGLLDDFTPHHRRLYETIDLLSQAEEGPFVTGAVYEAYRERCADARVTPLSERRISVFLTHLVLLDLLTVTHHPGGVKGKTREFQLTDWTKDTSSEEV